LGSAAGIFTVAGAQAADLSTKAEPVEYVKACSLYGAAFWYVPGTDTCIKVGAFARLQAGYGGGGTFAGGSNVQPGTGDCGGALDRTTNMFNFQTRGAVSFDMRQQSQYGTLRSYIDVGASVQSNPGGYGGSAPVGPSDPLCARSIDRMTQRQRTGRMKQRPHAERGRCAGIFDLAHRIEKPNGEATRT
jgi:Porin subfamily